MGNSDSMMRVGHFDPDRCIEFCQIVNTFDSLGRYVSTIRTQVRGHVRVGALVNQSLTQIHYIVDDDGFKDLD